LNASLDEETARRAAEFVAANYVANGGKVRFQELKEGLEAVLGLRIPEDLLRAYFGIEKVYIMVKLRPQSDVSRVVSEVSGWQDVEAVDEVYGDMDLVIVGRAASGPNNLVERVRRALLGIAEEMKVLVTD
ncbi:MAG: Lrp/AsnC ligand binding domain-containing protein, partial [Aigarchaeota archaeon]|nr:Lrp/AsnC ligand binding domain-containing protein [Aigarchaeota archaeon]